MCTVFWWANLREGAHWGDADAYMTIILRWMKGRHVHKFLIGEPEEKRPLV
jgi:hypothetical protein